MYENARVFVGYVEKQLNHGANTGVILIFGSLLESIQTFI